MSEWLAICGVAQATWFVFRPILEDLAKDVAKDAAKGYVQKCFKNVFSVIYREPLTKATGRALKELLELIQNELLDCDLGRHELQDWIDDVRKFTQHEDVPRKGGRGVGDREDHVFALLGSNRHTNTNGENESKRTGEDSHDKSRCRFQRPRSRLRCGAQVARGFRGSRAEAS